MNINPASYVKTSNTSANASFNLDIAAVAGQTNFIQGFIVDGLGATAGSEQIVAIQGLAGGTLNYRIIVPTGALVKLDRLLVIFPEPLPASGPNVLIRVVVPAFGAGNTISDGSVWGFRQ